MLNKGGMSSNLCKERCEFFVICSLYLIITLTLDSPMVTIIITKNNINSKIIILKFLWPVFPEPNFGNFSFPIRVIFKEPYAEIFKNFSVVALGVYRLNELIKWGQGVSFLVCLSWRQVVCQSVSPNLARAYRYYCSCEVANLIRYYPSNPSFPGPHPPGYPHFTV